jgi:hypothetical protein
MAIFNVEITDTFGGEANYSWVKRYQIKAKSFRGAITALAKKDGSGWRIDWSDGETTRYNLQGACICAFVTFEGE